MIRASKGRSQDQNPKDPVSATSPSSAVPQPERTRLLLSFHSKSPFEADFIDPISPLPHLQNPSPSPPEPYGCKIISDTVSGFYASISILWTDDVLFLFGIDGRCLTPQGRHPPSNTQSAFVRSLQVLRPTQTPSPIADRPGPCKLSFYDQVPLDHARVAERFQCPRPNPEGKESPRCSLGPAFFSSFFLPRP